MPTHRHTQTFACMRNVVSLLLSTLGLVGLLAFGFLALKLKFAPESLATWAAAHGFRSDWVLYPPPKLVHGCLFGSLFALVIGAKLRSEFDGPSGKHNTSHGSARLATTKEVRNEGNGRTGVVLCIENSARLEKKINDKGDPYWTFRRSAPLICTKHYHVLLEGPTGAGKGQSVFLPTLLTDVHRSHVVLDPKGELWDESAGYRSAFGHVRRFAPTEPGSACTNPLLSIPLGTSRAVLEAERIAQVLCGALKDEKDNSFFYAENAMPLLTAALIYVLYRTKNRDGSPIGPRERSIPGAYRLLFRQRGRKQEDIVTEIMDGLPPEAADLAAALDSMLQDKKKGLPDIFTTCRNALKFCRLEDVARAISGQRSDPDYFEPQDLFSLDKPLTIYMVLPFHDSNVLRALTRMLLNEFLSSHRKKTSRTTCYSLDEVPSIGLIPALAEGIGTLRGYGVQFLLGAQSEASFEDIYGRAKGQVIVDNCRARVYLGLTGARALEAVSTALGKSTYVTARKTKAVSRKSFLETTTTETSGEGQHARELMTQDEVRALGGDSAIVLLPDVRPYIGKRPVTYALPDLKKRSMLPPPTGSGARGAA